ncbi:MAG: hypothetical protein L0207_05385 [Chlamydiae bacterium]|nr:hypothetical protein [Chlamydiota bacterium]
MTIDYSSIHKQLYVQGEILHLLIDKKDEINKFSKFVLNLIPLINIEDPHFPLTKNLASTALKMEILFREIDKKKLDNVACSLLFVKVIAQMALTILAEFSPKSGEKVEIFFDFFQNIQSGVFAFKERDYPVTIRKIISTFLNIVQMNALKSNSRESAMAALVFQMVHSGLISLELFEKREISSLICQAFINGIRAGVYRNLLRDC